MLCPYGMFIYNATIQNNSEIDRGHNYELYIATASIKHKSVDCIKTVLRFWLTQHDEAHKNDFNNNNLYDVSICHCYEALR